MNCPKCISPMVKVIFHNIEVDRCTDCQGLWFDEFEKEELEKLQAENAKLKRELEKLKKGKAAKKVVKKSKAAKRR